MHHTKGKQIMINPETGGTETRTRWKRITTCVTCNEEFTTELSRKNAAVPSFSCPNCVAKQLAKITVYDYLNHIGAVPHNLIQMYGREIVPKKKKVNPRLPAHKNKRK